MEEHGLAPSTIERPWSTVSGFYRFAHIDGRITSNPAQIVRRTKVPPSEGHGMVPGELGRLVRRERCNRLQPVGATHNARSRLTDGAVASARVEARGRWRAPPASSDTPCLRAAIARL